MYDNGLGRQRDQVEAAKSYRNSAEQGFPDTPFNLVEMCSSGESVPELLDDIWVWEEGGR